MPSTTLADITAQLDLDPGLADDARALRKAIRTALNDLGSSDAEGTRDWHAQLIVALGQVDMIMASDDGAATSEITKTSQELVTLPAEAVSSLLRLLENREVNVPEPGPTLEQKAELQLRESQASSRLEATKDFRKGRTYPFAGLGGAIALAWGLREPLGITDIHVPGIIYLAGTAAGIGVTAAAYWIAHVNQERDERVLDALYETEVQERALRDLADREEFVFDKSTYIAALSDEIEHGYYVHVLPGFRPRLGSTVNLLGALRDAAILGLERFVAAGVLEKKQSGVLTVYEIPKKNRSDEHVGRSLRRRR